MHVQHATATTADDDSATIEFAHTFPETAPRPITHVSAATSANCDFMFLVVASWVKGRPCHPSRVSIVGSPFPFDLHNFEAVLWIAVCRHDKKHESGLQVKL